MDTITLGRRVRTAREVAGLSQRDLAKLANIHQSQISRIENGERQLFVSELYAIARACRATVSDILEGM
jgi:transcriptional regulator with XRE-family HTH domain